MSSSNVEGVRRYFTDQEWMKIPDYMKVRYGNIKENYDKMVALGLQPPIPEFMNAKPAARNAPAKSSSCGSSGRKVKRTSCDLEPDSKTSGKSPVRRSTRVQARTKKASENKALPTTDAQVKRTSVSRYPKRSLKNITYTESEDASEDESPTRKARAIAQVPRLTRKVPARRTQNTAPGKVQHKCRYGCSHEDPSECPVHGPSFYVRGVPLEDFELAKKSLPKGLAVLRSKIKGAQLGIFTVEPLAEGHCFGPYAHSSAKPNVSQAADEEEGEREPPKTGEAGPEIARWICYANCAPSEHQCNLVVVQQAGLVYYQTCQPLEQSAELMVWCGIVDSVAPPPPIAMPSWRTAFDCDICGCTCSSKWQLDKHRDATHPSAQCDSTNEKSREAAKSFVCHVCCNAFSTKVGVDRHLAIHASVKPFKCEECAESFPKAVLLKRHKKRHTGALMYKCPECGREFGMVTHFKSHVQSHAGLKPYSCRVCGRAFARKCHWSRHEILMHGKR